MIKTLFIAALLLPACAGASGAKAAPKQVAALPAQQPQQVINLSLMEALVAVERADMVGVFTFVPEENSALAMADMLMREHKSMKLFFRKLGKDKKVAGGISEWDKQVLLYMVGLDANAASLGVEPLSGKLQKQVYEFSLMPAYPLQVIVEKRRSQG
ncbi:MAG: hypothetical protein WCU88_11255 [Elusimicrobiota bacterium]|jgi:hypothetical protein